MKTYSLLDGTRIDLSTLSTRERTFVRHLRRMADEDISYFEIARTAVGPGSPALRGRNTVDRRTAASPLYLAAEDIATRAGISQGLILTPENEHLRDRFPTDGSHISATQAADLIGISRAAVHKAINAGTLEALHIGNVTVVNRKSAQAYRERRESRNQPSGAPFPATRYVEARGNPAVDGRGRVERVGSAGPSRRSVGAVSVGASRHRAGTSHAAESKTKSHG